jgi:hypothetical protein
MLEKLKKHIDSWDIFHTFLKMIANNNNNKKTINKMVIKIKITITKMNLMRCKIL